MTSADNEWPESSAMTLGARIKFARERAELTQQNVADVFGVTRNAVSRWENNADYPETHRLMKLPAVLRCPAHWLSNVEQEQSKDDDLNVTFLGARDATPRKIPLISRVPGGPEAEAADPYSPGSAEDWLTPSEPMGARSFALRVYGDSMEPEFPDGCVIFVDPSARWASGDFVVVRFDDSADATFKRIVRDGSKLLLVPINPQYPTRELNGNFTVCGVVREMRKLYLSR